MRELPVGHVQRVLLDRQGWCDAMLGLPPLDMWRLCPIVWEGTVLFLPLVCVELVCTSGHMSRPLQLEADRDLTTAQVVPSNVTSALPVVGTGCMILVTVLRVGGSTSLCSMALVRDSNIILLVRSNLSSG